MDSPPQNGSEPRPDQATAPEPQPAPPAPVPPAPHSKVWIARVETLAESGCHWLMRPRVRLSVAGVGLLLLGGLLITNSVWTLPLVVVGALMVVVAWIGHRLDGRFAVEWGEAGTELAFRATIKAAQPPEPHSKAPRTGTPELVAADDDVIEGEAHTVEIDVAELKALIAAAEAAEAGGPRDVIPQDIRIRRGSLYSSGS